MRGRSESGHWGCVLSEAPFDEGPSTGPTQEGKGRCGP